MHNQPEARPKAKRLADYIAGDTTQDINAEIAQELRRLHAENERLRIEAQNSNEAWDALTDHAGRVSVENERLRAAAALVRAQTLAELYPLPNDLYPGSKDWTTSDYSGRVQWLHAMYESKEKEVDLWIDQIALARSSALEEAAAELDHDWPADTIEERTMRKQYAKLIRALKASPDDSRN